MIATVLDNPAWEALNSIHAGFAQGTDAAKRYRAGILSFTGCRGGDEGSMEELDPFIQTGESFYIIGNTLPLLPAGWTVELELPCAQMLLENNESLLAVKENNASVVVQLGETDATDMFELINQVQPGYFSRDTRLLGTYFGIRDKGRLVAMAGERMRMNGFSELSAICTLPDYTGRGYAQNLVAALCSMHAKNQVVSFLQVALSNHRAIGLYKHLGFLQRRTIVFRKIKKQ